MIRSNRLTSSPIVPRQRGRSALCRRCDSVDVGGMEDRRFYPVTRLRRGIADLEGYWFKDEESPVVYLTPAGTGGRFIYPNVKTLRKEGWVESDVQVVLDHTQRPRSSKGALAIRELSETRQLVASSSK